MDEQLTDTDLGRIEARAGSGFMAQWSSIDARKSTDDDPITISATDLGRLLDDRKVLLAEVKRCRRAATVTA